MLLVEYSVQTHLCSLRSLRTNYDADTQFAVCQQNVGVFRLILKDFNSSMKQLEHFKICMSCIMHMSPKLASFQASGI